MYPETIIVLVIIIIISFTTFKLYQIKLRNQIIEKAKETLSKYGKLYQDQKMDLIDINSETYQVLFFNVYQNAELTVNSKTVWEIKSQGKPLIINQSGFLSSNYKKIVIIYPSTYKIKRYINENELEFVQYNKPFYNMYLVRYLELIDLLKELSK
jgi:c-di-AMP phosphodiesterase-like protein